MKVVVLTGALFPKIMNNANILIKLLPYLEAHNLIHLQRLPDGEQPEDCPEAICGIPVSWLSTQHGGIRQKYFYSVLAKVFDRKGFSDYKESHALFASIEDYLRHNLTNAVIVTMEPFVIADAASRIKGIKKILYLMDPPASLLRITTPNYRKRSLNRIIASYDYVITTPFIRELLLQSGFSKLASKIIPVGFPLIEQHNTSRRIPSDDKIRLLFCGWLYAGNRSPKFFLDIVSRLDDRFIVTFMGKECENLKNEFDFTTKAEVITMPQQSYEAAIQAMTDADILINIGNTLPVHLPSKTLEYINTGKPFVNFYKRDDCPTLFYTSRYPLCFNISEQTQDIDMAAKQFADFCIANKGRVVDRSFIESEFADCTPQYIAHIISCLLEGKQQ